MMRGGYVWENISGVMELRCVVAGGAAGKGAPEEEEVREA